MTKKHLITTGVLALLVGGTGGYLVGSKLTAKEYEQHLANYVLGQVAVHHDRIQAQQDHMRQSREAAEKQHREFMDNPKTSVRSAVDQAFKESRDSWKKLERERKERESKLPKESWEESSKRFWESTKTPSQIPKLGK